MSSLALNELIVTLIVVALPAWFTARIARKAGFYRQWVILLIVPALAGFYRPQLILSVFFILNIILIWVFAFVPWPVLGRIEPNTMSSLPTPPTTGQAMPEIPHPSFTVESCLALLAAHGYNATKVREDQWEIVSPTSSIKRYAYSAQQLLEITQTLAQERQ